MTGLMVDALMRCYDNEKAGEGTRTRRKNARCKQSVVHPQLGTRTHSFVRDTCVVFRGTVFVRLRVCIFVAIYMCNSCTCVCVCLLLCTMSSTQGALQQYFCHLFTDPVVPIAQRRRKDVEQRTHREHQIPVRTQSTP